MKSIQCKKNCFALIAAAALGLFSMGESPVLAEYRITTHEKRHGVRQPRKLKIKRASDVLPWGYTLDYRYVCSPSRKKKYVTDLAHKDKALAERNRRVLKMHCAYVLIDERGVIVGYFMAIPESTRWFFSSSDRMTGIWRLLNDPWHFPDPGNIRLVYRNNPNKLLNIEDCINSSWLAGTKVLVRYDRGIGPVYTDENGNCVHNHDLGDGWLTPFILKNGKNAWEKTPLRRR